MKQVYLWLFEIAWTDFLQQRFLQTAVSMYKIGKNNWTTKFLIRKEARQDVMIATKNVPKQPGH